MSGATDSSASSESHRIDEPNGPARQVIARLPGARRPLIIGHRGAAASAPENTLSSFTTALDAGADFVELDYFHSADGVPMAFHDQTLDRTTDAASVFGRSGSCLGDWTAAELARLDAGRWFDRRFAGERIPTLAESLARIQSRAMTMIEHKQGDAPTLVELLRSVGQIERVVVHSFDWTFLADCRRLAPELALGALGDHALTAERIHEIARLGFDPQVLGWNEKFVGRREIEIVHDAAQRLWVYTVNDPDRAVELASNGIDGVITDRPAEIRSALRAN